MKGFIVIQPLKSFALFAVTAAIASSSSVALAAPTSWDMPAGDHGTYTYSNGQNATNEFGTGTAFSGGFFFVPINFLATAPGGTSTPGLMGLEDSASDTASVILNAKANQRFSRITSSFLGDYTIDGIGLVDAGGQVRVTNLDTSATLTSPLAFGGTVPVATTDSADGIFSGTTGIDLPEGWRNIRVDFDASLFAAAFSGSSFIQVKDGEIGVTTAEIPLPAAVFVAPVAAFFGWRAKRKLGAAR